MIAFGAIWLLVVVASRLVPWRVVALLLLIIPFLLVWALWGVVLAFLLMFIVFLSMLALRRVFLAFLLPSQRGADP